MHKNADAAQDTDAAPNDPLRSVFEAPLHRAAQQLIDRGEVSDVRVLQDGRVVTGVAGGRQRVYIRLAGGTGTTIEGECSCEERAPCVHVAAVAMTAAKLTGAMASRGAGAAQGITKVSPPQAPQAPERDWQRDIPRQSLCYLIESDTIRGFKLSPWVLQTSADFGQAKSAACPFALRIPDGGNDYPRYVDTDDRAILEALTARQLDGDLTGTAAFHFLQQTLATGRAFWRSLQTKPLRAAAAREVRFSWQAEANGDQLLRCEQPDVYDFLLQLEPAAYVDTTSGDCGPLELPYPVDLLEHYWNRRVIEPADAPAFNAQLAREPRANFFPRPRVLKIQAQALSSLQPRLTLIAGPATALHFVYNGMAIAADSLRTAALVVSRLSGNVIYQIARDIEWERQRHTQLAQFLPADAPLMLAFADAAEAWLEFMMNGVPALRALGWDIAIDAAFPYRLATADDWYTDLQTTGATRPDHPRGLRQSREWFDLWLGVMVDGRAVNLLPALVLYLSGVAGQSAAGQHETLSIRSNEHLHIRLEDGRYLPVPLTRIQRIADVLVELCDRDALTAHQALRLRRTQAGRLAQLALGAIAPALHSDDPELLHLIDAVKDHACIEPLAGPIGFTATLRPYQADGLGWLQFLRRHSLGGILADDMGLGKTVQTIAHLLIEKQQNRLGKPSLIVAPVSVLGNWQHEIHRFAPELRSLMLHGSRRRESFALIDSADVIIIGYSSLLLESDMLLQREFCFVILDEAQTIKNPQAKVSQVARALRAEHRLCLTGTPMENHLGDLWSLFDFVQPGLLGERSQFQRHYRTPIENGGNTQRAAALRHRIHPFLLRRTKDTVARDLPPKIQIVEPIDLDEKQRDFYDGIRLGQHRRVRAAIEMQGLERSRITVLDALLKLRQACCDPRLVNLETQTQDAPSAKLDWLSTMLPALIAEGRRILLFSQFTSMLHLIEKVVKALCIPYCVLTGDTRQRTEMVARFQDGGVPLFLISLKAGGTGLNLTAADTIIHYDPWWNPTTEAQATDRAHRIGQNKPVFVYKLIARGTVEEKILQLQADKHALVSQLYAEKSASPSQLCSADLDALFAP
jgi:superfamily II DNA or RNA helicase